MKGDVLYFKCPLSTELNTQRSDSGELKIRKIKKIIKFIRRNAIGEKCKCH